MSLISYFVMGDEAKAKARKAEEKKQREEQYRLAEKERERKEEEEEEMDAFVKAQQLEEDYLHRFIDVAEELIADVASIGYKCSSC